LAKNRQTRHAGPYRCEQFQSLTGQLVPVRAQTRDVATRSGQTGDEALPYGITTTCHDNRDGVGGLFSSSDQRGAVGYDNVHWEGARARREVRESILLPIREARLRSQVVTFYIAEIAQALQHHPGSGWGRRRTAAQEAHAGDPRSWPPLSPILQGPAR